MSTSSAPPVDVSVQPVSRVRWVPRDRLRANSWNPNRQAPPEHRLLETSILETGWTQPIVVHREGEDEHGPLFEIVDGYHRWLVSQRPEVATLTGEWVPIVELIEPDPVLARMATIRHNRARGVHHVLGMADIIADLLSRGVDPVEIGHRLEMDPEEVDRLADRGNMLTRHAGTGYSNGWTVS